MKGTEAKPVRCIALVGEIGNSVACQIYDKRSSTCQSVQVGDEQCIKARHHYGLSNDIFSQLPA
jgi:Fe-S-cluster containining protein